MNEFFIILVSIALLTAVIKFFVLPNVRLLMKYYHLKRYGILRKAKIVDYQKENDNDGVTFYFPLIQFTTEEGELIKGKLSVGKPKYELETKNYVPIYIDPKKPENFIEKSREPLVLGWISIIISILTCSLVFNYIYIKA